MQEARLTKTHTFSPKAYRLLEEIAKVEDRPKSKSLDRIILDYAKRNRISVPANK